MGISKPNFCNLCGNKFTEGEVHYCTRSLLDPPNTVAVPVRELEALERARKELYRHLEDHIGAIMFGDLTRQIWLVAHTRKWD